MLRTGKPVAAGLLQAEQGRDVRPRAGREHQVVVLDAGAGAGADDASVSVDRDRRLAESNGSAGRDGGRRTRQIESVAGGSADRVLGDQHAVVHVVVLGTEHGECDATSVHGGQYPLHEPGSDGPETDHDDVRHAGVLAFVRVTRVRLNSGIAEIGSTRASVSRLAR